MLKRIVLIALLIVTFAGASHAQSGVHLNALLNRRFPVSQAAYVLSGSPDPAFSFVWKSYGHRTENLSTLLKLLTSPTVYNKPTVHVIVYGSCGPCRPPRRPSKLFPIVINQSISTLNRNLEKKHKPTLDEFRKEWTSLNAIMPTINGVTYIFIEELEDNFTRKAYRNLHRISLEIFGSRPDVQYGRNALDGSRSSDRWEWHDDYDSSYFRFLAPGSIMGGDGYNVQMGDNDFGVSMSIVRKWILAARKYRLITLVYRSETQGLPPVSSTTKVLIPPSKRTYKFSEAKKLHDLLK